MKSVRLAMVFLGVSLASSGCASWFMNGGKLVDTSYSPSVKATYTVPSCNLSNGSTTPGPARTTYELVQDANGTGIFERGPDGSGAVITNRWSDDKGDHYFGWVKSQGWEYVIPKDSSQAPQRLVYVGLETTKEGDVTKPTSPVVGRCPMVAAN